MTISTTRPRKGEIWRVRFDPSKGDEIKKVRPAAVINEDELSRLALSIVVPITDWKDRYAKYPWFVKLPPTAQNGLSKMSGADSFQVKSVSHTRFEEKIGVVSDYQLENIIAAVALCVGYQP